MAFDVYCECGQPLAVSESDAGSSLACPCGRPVVVPLIVELRARRVMTSAATIGRRIRRMIANNELPYAEECARCGDRMAARVVKTTVECERYRTRTTGGLRYIWIPFLFHMWWTEEERTELLGRDTDMPAPISLCLDCEKHLREPGVRRYWFVAVLLCAVSLLIMYAINWVGLILLPFSFALPYWLHRRAMARRQRALRKLLRVEPVYGQLLDRYPYGTVVLPVEQ